MRLTDRQSMGSRALMPQPTSQKAPKDQYGSRCRAGYRRGTADPDNLPCTGRLGFGPREQIAGVSLSVRGKILVNKQVGRPTRVTTAISRTAPRSAAVSALCKGHHAPHTPQLQTKAGAGYQRQCGALQDLAPLLCSTKLRCGQTSGTAIVGLGTESLHHLSFLFLLVLACPGQQLYCRVSTSICGAQRIFAF